MKKRAIRETIKRSKCPIICLQETKQNLINSRRQEAICGPNLEGWEAIDAQGTTAGGLLTCWDVQRFDWRLLEAGTYSLTIKFTSKSTGLSWMLSNIYDPHNEQDHHVHFSKLNSVKATNMLPWVLIGDFNATRFSSECRAPANNQKTFRLLNKFVTLHKCFQQIIHLD